MSTQAEDKGHIVAIQIGDHAPEIHTEVSVEDAVKLASRADESLGERLRSVEDRLRMRRKSRQTLTRLSSTS